MKRRRGTRRCARGRIGHRRRERTEPWKSGSNRCTRCTGIRASSSGSRARRGSGGDDGGGGEHGVHEGARKAPGSRPVKRRIATVHALRPRTQLRFITVVGLTALVSGSVSARYGNFSLPLCPRANNIPGALNQVELARSLTAALKQRCARGDTTLRCHPPKGGPSIDSLRNGPPETNRRIPAQRGAIR